VPKLDNEIKLYFSWSAHKIKFDLILQKKLTNTIHVIFAFFLSFSPFLSFLFLVGQGGGFNPKHPGHAPAGV